MELKVQWQEHELDAYPTIVLTWEEGDAPRTLGIHRKSAKKL